MEELNKVSTTLKGGLGNYMFQIAATEAYSLDHNKIPVYSFDLAIAAHKDIALYRDNIFRDAMQGGWDGIDTMLIEPSFEYNKLPFAEGSVMLDGYFQSEKYFEKHSNQIREMFSESPESTDYIESKYGNLFAAKDLVSMHVRRGDYKKYPKHHPMLSLDYYKKAIDIFVKRDKSSFLVFSDDVEWCRKNFVGPVFDDVELIYSNNEFDYIDMYLMARCRNNIIANSTFSWWGAWLNNNTSKQIVAPNKWFGRALKGKDTSDLIPGTWREISCK